jgi:hypothetical protein
VLGPVLRIARPADKPIATRGTPPERADHPVEATFSPARGVSNTLLLGACDGQSARLRCKSGENCARFRATRHFTLV